MKPASEMTNAELAVELGKAAAWLQPVIQTVPTFLREAASRLQAPAVAEVEVKPEPAVMDGSWPAGCIKRNSCARNFRCMYGWNGSCPHESRSISDEVAAAIALRTGGSE